MDSEPNNQFVETMKEGARVQKFYNYLWMLRDELNKWKPIDDEEDRLRTKQIELMIGIADEFSENFDHTIAR